MSESKASFRDYFETPKVHINFSDYIIDFISCLVPGFVFVVIFLGICATPILFFHGIYENNEIDLYIEYMLGFNTEFMIFSILLAYIMGHIFYRMDPKEPDVESYWYIRDNLKNDGPVKECFYHLINGVSPKKLKAWDGFVPTNSLKKLIKLSKKYHKGLVNGAEQNSSSDEEGVNNCTFINSCKIICDKLGDDKRNKENHVCTHTCKIKLDDKPIKNVKKYYQSYKENVKVLYPYSHLKQYLYQRGFDDLASMVPWDDRNIEARSKHFINAIKIRLSIVAPQFFTQIARNEAHVRLMSSVWYMSKTLVKSSLVLIALLGCIYGYYIFYEKKLTDLTYATVCFSLIPVVVLIFCLFIQKKMKQFFHYQRIREIVYVLETALHIHKQQGNVFCELGGVNNHFRNLKL